MVKKKSFLKLQYNEIKHWMCAFSGKPKTFAFNFLNVSFKFLSFSVYIQKLDYKRDMNTQTYVGLAQDIEFLDDEKSSLVPGIVVALITRFFNFFGRFCNVLECFGIFWNLMEYFGILWNILEYFGIFSYT